MLLEHIRMHVCQIVHVRSGTCPTVRRS